jgi:hypothetical protein
VFTSDGEVLFCQTSGKSTVAQQRSQVTQHSSGIKHNDAGVRSKDRPRRESLIGLFSAASSPGSSKFVTFAATVCAKHPCLQTYQFLV